MKINKPIFWDSLNLISIILIPLSLITNTINFFKSFVVKKKFKIKSICVGNIYVGGTGKTPLVLMINDILRNKYKTVFIKKKYNDQIDEQKILSRYGKLICLKHRKYALKIAHKKKYQLAILDDGLQEKGIKYNISIVCFNSSDLIGNGLVLPAGPLREQISNILNYDLAFLNGMEKNLRFEKYLKKLNPKLKIFRAKYVPKNLKSFNLNKKYLMFSGIGNPSEFEKTLKKYKFNLKKNVIFPDHYRYKKHEIVKIKKIAKEKNLNIITNEKDYNRLSKSDRKNIQYLSIKLQVEKEKEFKDFLLKNL